MFKYWNHFLLTFDIHARALGREKPINLSGLFRQKTSPALYLGSRLARRAREQVQVYYCSSGIVCVVLNSSANLFCNSCFQCSLSPADPQHTRGLHRVVKFSITSFPNSVFCYKNYPFQTQIRYLKHGKVYILHRKDKHYYSYFRNPTFIPLTLN